MVHARKEEVPSLWLFVLLYLPVAVSGMSCVIILLVEVSKYILQKEEVTHNQLHLHFPSENFEKQLRIIHCCLDFSAWCSICEMPVIYILYFLMILTDLILKLCWWGMNSFLRVTVVKCTPPSDKCVCILHDKNGIAHTVNQCSIFNERQTVSSDHVQQ